MRVALQNKATGQIKFQKIGWSWTCFFFSGSLGIPLFVRGLYAWGALMVVLWLAGFFTSILPVEEAILSQIGIVLFGIGFAIYFGIKANTLAGLHYLENGWEFAEPNSAATSMAKQKWRIIFDRSSAYSDLTATH